MTLISSSGVAPGWTGAVLAGGASSRMGRNKATLELDSGERLIDSACALLRDTCDEVLVVGSSLPLPREVRHVQDPVGTPAGPAAGLLGALEASGRSQVLILPVDVPGLVVSILRRIQERSESVDCRPVVPVGLHGPEPLVSAWPKKLAPRIRNLIENGTRGVWDLAHALGAMHLPFEELGDAARICAAFRNINTPREWEIFLRDSTNSESA